MAPPRNVAHVLETANTPEGRAQLRSWALDVEVEPSLRYVALRRLEELEALETNEVAGALLHDEHALLRVNAQAVLNRRSR